MQVDGTGQGGLVSTRTGNDSAGDTGYTADEEAAQMTIQTGKIGTSKTATVLMTIVFDNENDDCYVHGHATTEGGVPIHLI